MNNLEKIWHCHKNEKITATHSWSGFMTNNIGNNETLVIHGLSGLVLKFLRMNSEKLRRGISITQFLNVIDLQYMPLNMCSSR